MPTSPPPSGSAEQLGCGCLKPTVNMWAWVLAIIAAGAIFTGFYNYEGETFTESVQFGTEFLRVECHGEKAVAPNPPGAWDRYCEQGMSSRRELQGPALTFGVISGVLAIALFAKAYDDKKKKSQAEGLT